MNHSFVPSLITLLLLATGATAAPPKLPHIFSDHMVLQRDQPVRIWGSAGENQTATVSFAGQKKSAPAKDGKWLVTFDPMPANAVGQDLAVTVDKETLVLKDVLVGDVWICGGQSNMEWRLKPHYGEALYKVNP